jgi:hypothetical protein
MSKLESRWLIYARQVVRGGPCKECSDRCDGDPRIRCWPGYLGKHYTKGRVLLVGEAHHEKSRSIYGPVIGPFFTDSMLSVQSQVRDWYQDKISPREYLNAVRDAYKKSIEAWRGGGVWGCFEKIYAGLGRTLDQVASTNLAKCYCEPGCGDRLAMACVKRYPVKQLIEALEPKAVFIAKSTRASRKLHNPLNTDNCRVWQYDNMHQTLWDPAGHKWIEFAEWFHKARDAYQQM